MSLSRHIDPESIINHLHKGDQHGKQGPHLTPYSSRYASQQNIPKYNIPIDGAPADTVYAMIKDELNLDGRPTLNLASFVNTNLEENEEKLMMENLVKNLADNDEYPVMLSMSERCVSIIAHLWGVQNGEKAIGAPTVGSSEAIHLGGLAMKRRWQERRRSQGKDTLKPNIIMGANAQVALEKFARYFEVEARVLPVSKKSDYRLDPDLVRENIDENTIGIFVILGSTYTGHYEPVEDISQILDEYEAKTGIDIPIHVDAASGGFVAPFTHAGTGDKKWDFQLARVKSINASGHKYGLVCAGLGWVIWRDESYLPKDLIFELHYLGGTEQSYTLNFSRPGAQVILQYYNLTHLGFNGYREVMENCLANARLLSKSLEATGFFTCLSSIHQPAPPYTTGSITSHMTDTVKHAISSPSTQNTHRQGNLKTNTSSSHEFAPETSASYIPGLPVVAFRLSDAFRSEYPHIKQETISLLMRARQWIIPNYALPPGESDTEILRVVVRESMSFDLLDRLVTDLVQVTEELMEHDTLDVEILQSQHRSLRHRHKVRQEGAGGKWKGKKKGGGKKGEGREECGDDDDDEGKKVSESRREVERFMGKRMAEGIHRSVC